MQKLNEIIKSLDGKAVSSYTKLYGRYERNGIVYHIRNVYGGQIKNALVSAEIPRQRLFGEYVYDSSDKTAAAAYIMRDFSMAAHVANDTMQQSESNVQKGLFLVYKFGTRVLSNSVVQLNEETITISLTIKLPFNNTAYNTGRRADPELGIKAQSGSVLALSAQAQKDSFNSRKKGIISEKALKLLLTKNLPTLVEDFVSNFDANALWQAVELWQNQEYIRRYLKNNGYVSFVANGSVLPRKGKTDYKDSKGAVPFVSPKSMQINIALPSGENISGMAIPEGITLITGDAYHGKSTILEALKEGVYNHVLGDGREYVITNESAMTIQAEDGRSIKNTDISFFLRKLPVKGIVPQDFSTDNASGSTSQAAAVTEAIEAGCRLMLFDEDRSANNFMYKDEKMRSVIQNASTAPFLDNARMFYEKYGMSSIIVVGASGEYFRIADQVILVENFVVSEYTEYEQDKRISAPAFSPQPRRADFSHLGGICLARNVEIKDDSTIQFGAESVRVPEIVPHATRGQLDFIGSFIYYLTVIEQRQSGSMREAVMRLYKKMETGGLEMIHQTGFRGTSGVIEYVRPEDVLAVLYRLKSIRFKGR
ncbi:MAG: hypothetical protein IJ281_05630 [Clostridia bacterium]|nr:hypothetical protein [Clostridia bacterium]